MHDYGISLKKTHGVIFQEREKKTADPPDYIIYQSYSEVLMRHTMDISAYLETERKRKVSTCPPLNHLQKLLSKKSRTRIKNAVNLLLECSDEKELVDLEKKTSFKYKVGFMTLTIPEDCKLTDEAIHYKVFKPFIRRLKVKFDLAEYLWKAETQDNGQLHYHLTINVFIHWFFINREWNNQLKKNGYTFKTTDHERASTEIHSTKNVRDMAAYLCSYVAKKDEWKKKTPKNIIKKYELLKLKNEIDIEFESEIAEWKKRIPEIKLWDCSNNLRGEKLTFRNVVKDYPELCISIGEVMIEEIQKDFYSIYLFDSKKFSENIYLSYQWWRYINDIKMKGKQKPKYFIEKMKVSADDWNIIFEP